MESKISQSTFQVTNLPRGGFLIRWGSFVAQLGAYPETIKDTLKGETGVPDLFILPKALFDIHNGVSLSELEFPLYYNFYIRKRKLRFVCRREQGRPILRLLREAVFGPSSFQLEREYPRGSESWGFPDLELEADYYRKANGEKSKFRDFIEPLFCSENDSVEIDGVKLTFLPGDQYRFERDGEVNELAFQAVSTPVFPPNENSVFCPPEFGITVLGAGHGFDVDSRTSGFILWIGGRGLLVDPPVHTTQWMKARNLDSRLVEDILLTHCHADHDSGTLQKVMEEGRVRLHTSPTVMNSFVRKYRSFLGLSTEELHQLFDFQPLLLDAKLSILGARFQFWYTFHPIPTLGFSVEYKGKTFAYSCDTLYDPKLFDELCEKGVFSEQRRDCLKNFPWDSDLIFHEAGIPPIHTLLSVLLELPEEVRDRMYLTHVSSDIIGKEDRIKVAPAGLSSTLILKDKEISSEMDLARELLDVLLHAEIFANCPIEKSLEFLHIAQWVKVAEGDTIIQEGEWGDRFFLVSKGKVAVYKEGEIVRTLGRYDFFGEMAIVLETPRLASIKALCDCELIAIDRNDFIKFIANTDLPELLQRIAQNKLNGLWPVMKLNRSLRDLTSFQRSQLMSILELRTYLSGELIFEFGTPFLEFFLISEGAVRLVGPRQEELVVSRGAMFGDYPDTEKLVTHEVSAFAVEETEVFVTSVKKLQGFLRRNPGTSVRIGRILRESPFSVAT